MAFEKTTILSTKQQVLGAFVSGQVVPVPTGRIDKVSLYLEPEISDMAAAAAISVTVDVYDLDISLIPTGSPLASDSRQLSDIVGGGLYNFRLEADLPIKVAIVLRCNGTTDNHVSWRYVQSPVSSTEYMLLSSDGGLTWSQDPNKKFSYAAFSLVPGVVSLDSQTATVRAGKRVTLTDTTDVDFSLAEFDRTKVEGTGEGATVVVDFGDFVVTLVLDQSGSMTWNDRDGVRFDFLKAYIDDMEASLSVIPGSEASYSLVKFRSRKIGRMSLSLQSAESAAAAFSGVRIVRKVGSPVTGPTDGLVIFEGIAEEILDGNLSTGTTYYYAAFSFDDAGNFSGPKSDLAVPLPTPKPPIGGAAFEVEEDAVTEFCPSLGDFADVGKRRVVLSWLDPANVDMLSSYIGFYVTRRTDRFPETPEDGTPMMPGGPSILPPFYDTLVPAGSPSLLPLLPGGSYVFSDFDPGMDATSSMTYYYSLFTENSLGVRCLAENARQASIKVSEVERLWLKSEPPLDTPTSHCFNAPYYGTPPSVPSVTILEGNGELLLTWAPGPVGPPPPAARYELYYSPTGYPGGKLNSKGQLDFSGDKLSDSEATSFVHRGLDNKQPHFYALVAYDRASNQAAAVQAFGRPNEDAVDVIQPAGVDQFSVVPINSTTVRISWKNPFIDQLSISAYFGDVIRSIGIVTYSDLDPRGTSAIFEIVENSRSAKSFDGLASDAVLATLAETGLEFSKDSKRGASVISGTLSVPPSLLLRNQLQDVQAQFYAALRIKDSSTGEVIIEVKTPTASARLSNPFDLSIKNEPAQNVSRKSYSFECDAENEPEEKVEQFPGVYVRTGESFHAVIETSFRGLPLESPLNVKLRILDKATGEPAFGVRLPGMDATGTVSLQLENQEDEELDRSDQPTGEVKTRTMISLDLPPQDVPGDYLIEATGSYLGYVRTTTVEMHFESSLNIDVKARGFRPDGSDVAEQEAFVYLGPPDAEEAKVPVADLTVVDWSLKVISAPRRRPLFSRDTVPGSGIKSYAREGIAKAVFFGPGAEIEPPTGETCTDGELYAIGAKVSYLGMTAEAFGFVELLPYESGSMNRILLRAVDGQEGSKGTESGFNKHIIYADGEMESQWEVVARPETDGVLDDTESGIYFRDGVTSIGGQVPSIDDGRVVTMFVDTRGGNVKPQDVLVKTNIAPAGQFGWAKARIDGGRALFTLSCNARVFGTIQKDQTSRSNILYGTGLEWFDSPTVFVLRASIVMEVNGRPVAFYGGGGNIDGDTPPAFLSLDEPLEQAD
jgi:hypothetical protein